MYGVPGHSDLQRAHINAAELRCSPPLGGSLEQLVQLSPAGVVPGYRTSRSDYTRGQSRVDCRGVPEVCVGGKAYHYRISFEMVTASVVDLLSIQRAGCHSEASAPRARLLWRVSSGFLSLREFSRPLLTRARGNRMPWSGDLEHRSPARPSQLPNLCSSGVCSGLFLRKIYSLQPWWLCDSFTGSPRPSRWPFSG